MNFQVVRFSQIQFKSLFIRIVVTTNSLVTTIVTSANKLAETYECKFVSPTMKVESHMIENIYTIGVYGSTEATFFDELVSAGIDLFVDIRQRRGVRGHLYAYANSTYLQEKLKSLGIDYLHYQSLAPTTALRQVQYSADAETKTAQRQREVLSSAFKAAYKKEILSGFDLDDFLSATDGHKRICLFCVEQHAEACHRSLAAARLVDGLHVPVIHLMPE